MPDKSLILYQGADQHPTTDYTDTTIWEETELPGAAVGGEASAGQWVVRDDNGYIQDHLTDTFLLPHNKVKLTVGSNTIWQGRIAQRTTSRGATTTGDAKVWNVTTEDQNAHLRGIIVHNWHRPEETDAARVQALVARYLSGNPRLSTNLNGSNFVVTGSNTVTLPAKKYTGVEPWDVLREIADETDKEFFVTVDDELFYAGHDYAGYDSILRISDNLADLNTVTCVPINPSATELSREIPTAHRTYWRDPNLDDVQRSWFSEGVVDQNLKDYWEVAHFDSESETAAQAERAASAYFARESGAEFTYSVTIGSPGTLPRPTVTETGKAGMAGQPMSGHDVWKIKPGQRIQVKSSVLNSGRNNDGSLKQDFFVTRRISEVRWTFPAADTYFATLELAKPRQTYRGSRTRTQTPKPAPEEVPDTPGTAIVTWDFEGGGSGTTMDTTDTWDSNLGLEDESDKCPNGAAWCGYITASHKSTDFITGLTPDTDYVLSGDVLWRTNPAIRDIGVGWNGGGHMDQILVDGSSGYAEDTTYSFSKTFHLPVGFDRVQVVFSPYGGFSVDNLVLSTVATAAENDEHSVDYGDCPHDSPYYLPSDYVECRLDNLQDQIDGRRVVSDVDPTPSDDELAGYPAGTLWVNQTTDMAWISVDGSEGVAVWERIDNEEPTSGRNTPLTGALSNPPTQTELDTLVGDTPDNLPGEQYIVTDNDTARVYSVWSDGIQWVGLPIIIFPGTAGGGGGPEPGGGADAEDTLKTLADSPAGGWEMVQ